MHSHGSPQDHHTGPRHSTGLITIATWNVNSVKTRLPHLLPWLKETRPDIVLLQEIKCVNEAFPSMEIEELGYNLALHGQKTYNGVAILSKFPLSDIRRGLPGDDTDEQARYIEAVVSLPRKQSSVDSCQLTEKSSDNCQLRTDNCAQALRVASVYVPNGQDADSDKFQYKLRFLERLHTHLKTLLGYGEALIVGGDYNIAPGDADVHNPKAWEGSVLTHDEVRKRFRKILYLGMYDASQLSVDSHQLTEKKAAASLTTVNCQLSTGGYTWWDYRANAFAANDGLRIDHLLLSPQAADMLSGCRVEKSLRALEKPSDHAPVVGSFSTPSS